MYSLWQRIYYMINSIVIGVLAGIAAFLICLGFYKYKAPILIGKEDKYIHVYKLSNIFGESQWFMSNKNMDKIISDLNAITKDAPDQCQLTSNEN